MNILNIKEEQSKTVAGKKCSVSLVEYIGDEEVEKKNIVWGGWQNITFWMYESIGSSDAVRGFRKLEVLDFTEAVPENSFLIPSHYSEKLRTVPKPVYIDTEDGRKIEVMVE